MSKIKIAVIPGDGIGWEVIPEGIKVLEAAGATLDDVVKVTTFLAHAEDYSRFAAVYEEFFTNEPLPTCSTVSAGQVWDHLIKLECIAYVGDT